MKARYIREGFQGDDESAKGDGLSGFRGGSSDRGIPWSGRDVAKTPVIGKIITKEWELDGGFKFNKAEYDVVEIIDEPGKSKIYVTNTWYKELKHIPQLIPEMFVDKYIPY